MKKIALFLIVSFLVITVTGCKTLEQKREDIMKEYATTYFNNHMIGIEPENGTQITVIQVTINMLKNVNELKREEQYNLSKLFGCKGESRVDLTIDPKTQNIEKYEFHLICE